MQPTLLYASLLLFADAPFAANAPAVIPTGGAIIADWQPGASARDSGEAFVSLIQDADKAGADKAGRETEAKEPASQPRTKTSRPNVIVIYADDLGYADVGVQGSKNIPTPNLDRIANEGVRFTSGYVMPWCAPSRSTLITGCWPGRSGSGRIGRPVPVPLTKLFEQAGYATAMYGKMHGHDTTGFQDALYFGPAGNAPEYPPKESKIWGPLTHNGKPYEVVDEYPTDLFTRLGVEWIKKNKDRPFLLYLPYQVAKLGVKPTADLLKRAGNIPGCETYRTAVWWTGNSAHHGMDYWNFSGKGRLHGELGMLTFVVPVSIAADIAARAWAS